MTTMHLILVNTLEMNLIFDKLLVEQIIFIQMLFPQDRPDQIERHKKIFCLGGFYPSARRALIKRGWVEVASRSRSAALLNTEKVKYSREGGGEDARYVFFSPYGV
mgnify:CR=1 FL=1